MSSSPNIVDTWGTETMLFFDYPEPNTKVKITGEYHSDTKKYHITAEIDGVKYESESSREYADYGLEHSNDDVSETYLVPAYCFAIGDHVVQFDAPGNKRLDSSIGMTHFDPFTMYSFKAWNTGIESPAVDLRPMAITDDDGSNPRGGMYDALTEEIYEAMRRDDFGNSKFEPIDPDYSQELFPETPARFFLRDQIPGEIYLGKNKIKSVKYGAETVWGGLK